MKAGDATRISTAKAKEAGESLRQFMSAVSKAGATIEVAGDALGLVSLKVSGKAITAFGKIADGKPAPPQISEMKYNLARSLRELGHRFIITVDDVDRLEPTEVIEILRLVRAVVDLPNVIYLLCYDSGILAHSIEKAAGVKSGQSYLEKIVQLTVMVPKPEAFQLRHWFAEDLHQIAPARDEDGLSRLKVVIDYEGGRQLRTPRSVVRALDAVRFFWPALREAKADLADLVWLQLIKEGNPALYRWIEDYCATAAAVSLGIARVDEAEKARQHTALLETVADGHFDDLMYRHYFSEQLPGFRIEHSKDKSIIKIFESVDDRSRDKAIQKRRLASPDHYRLYFALIGPSHALTQADVTSVWNAARDSASLAADALLRLYDEQAVGDLTKADVLFERIKGGAYEVLGPVQCESLLVALSNMMDAAYRRRPFDQLGVISLWDRAERLIPVLLSQLDLVRRAEVVTAMFSRGAAVDWLTSLFRHETFAHGRHDDRPRPAHESLFTNGELDKITELMLGRYRAMPLSEILNSIRPINILFAWQQGGDEQRPRQIIETCIRSDEGLVRTLELMTGTILVSGRDKYGVLKKENLSHFMDFENAAQRIHRLTSHVDLGTRATQLAVVFDNASKY